VFDLEIIHDFKTIPLTSSEIGSLWTTYIVNSKAKLTIMYTAETTEDQNIKEILQECINLSEKNIEGVKEIFNSADHPIPYGFSNYDVKFSSSKLFSDKLILHTLKMYIEVAVIQYSFALAQSARFDVRSFFSEGLSNGINLMNKVDALALNKGIFVRTPNIPVPKKVEFAEDKSMLGRFIGHKRPMTALETAGIFNLSMFSFIIKANMIAFAQTITDDRIKDYLYKTIRTLEEHTEELNDILHKENLSTPSNLDSEVLNSTEAPFSDKLSQYCTFTMLGDLMVIYSLCKLSLFRKDLAIKATHLSGEVAYLIKDSIEIMIDKGWFEEMPKNVDRADIIESNEKEYK
jgi:spore coat protein CotF